MYSVEYYKTKKIKPTEEIEKLNEMEKFDKAETLDKTWNIKSVTIDMEDIYHIPYERFNDKRFLAYFYSRYRNFENNVNNNMNGINAIKILNNNDINRSTIYEIITCDWMVDRNAPLDDLNALKTLKEYYTLYEKYNKLEDSKTKKDIINRIVLIKYYIDTVVNKFDNEQEKTQEDVKALKLGIHFIKK